MLQKSHKYQKTYSFSRKYLRRKASKVITFKVKGNLSKLKDSLFFSQDYLDRIRRKKFESYADHGVRVSETLSEVTDDPSLLSIALLHDILNHPNGKKLLSNSPLNKSEQRAIIKLHTLRNLRIDINKKDLDKVIKEFSRDYRLLLVRMAHRISDARALELLSKKKAKKIARETLLIYALLADKMGLRRWRYEMEDICFKYLYEKNSKKIEKQFKKYKKNDKDCLKHTKNYLSKEFKKANMNCRIEGRIKSLYSTYSKMVVKNKSFDEILDRLALRIIVNNTEDCYKALGVIQLSMHPIIGELKDYIASPKENGYRSLHTTIYPLPKISNRPMEIQIRSAKMHLECENGIASHLQYKIDNYNMRYSPKSRVDLIKGLEIIRSEIHSSDNFSKALRQHSRGKRLTIFDEKNRIYNIEKPANLLDFVCSTYGKRVAYLKEAKINGSISNIFSLIKDGDVIEVKFQKKSKISRSWIRKCLQKSSRNFLKIILKKANN